MRLSVRKNRERSTASTLRLALGIVVLSVCADRPELCGGRPSFFAIDTGFLANEAAGSQETRADEGNRPRAERGPEKDRPRGSGRSDRERRWKELDSERRERLRELFRKLQELDPEQRELIEKWAELPPEKRRELLEAARAKAAEPITERRQREYQRRLLRSVWTRMPAEERARLEKLSPKERHEALLEVFAKQRTRMLERLPEDIRAETKALEPSRQAQFLRFYFGVQAALATFSDAEEAKKLRAMPRRELFRALLPGPMGGPLRGRRGPDGPGDGRRPDERRKPAAEGRRPGERRGSEERRRPEGEGRRPGERRGSEERRRPEAEGRRPGERRRPEAEGRRPEERRGRDAGDGRPGDRGPGRRPEERRERDLRGGGERGGGVRGPDGRGFGRRDGRSENGRARPDTEGSRKPPTQPSFLSDATWKRWLALEDFERPRVLSIVVGSAVWPPKLPKPSDPPPPRPRGPGMGSRPGESLREGGAPTRGPRGEPLRRGGRREAKPERRDSDSGQNRPGRRSSSSRRPAADAETGSSSNR